MKSVSLFGFLWIIVSHLGFAQIGGTSTYKALSLPSSPRISALGGSALGVFDDDINLALDNPAFNQPKIHRQLSFSNNFYFANINYGTLAYAHHFDKIGTFNFSMKYIAYGEMEGRDEAGNFVGNFRAGDYVINTGYGSSYKEKWLYGANVKLIYSHLETYHSVGIAMDLSGAYHNEDKQFTFSAILKNVGFQIKAYTDAGREPIPLEFSLGLSKKFSNIPVRLNAIVHNLQQPDIAYYDMSLNNNTNLFGESEGNKPSVVDQIFRHFIFGAEIDIAKPLSIRFGYNHLVRQEAALPSKKGIAGVTMGAGVHIKQFSMDYAFAKYHAAANIHHLGITVNLEEFLGKKAKIEDEEN